MLVEDEKGQPLNVGRKTRTISAPLRRALNSRDKGCRFPGCCNKRYIDGHHVKHWANGGETKIANLVSLCRFHHRAVHDGGVQIQVLDDGAFRFITPNGESLDSIAEGFTQPISDWAELPSSNNDRGVAINARTAGTRWCGESMDYGLGIQVLLQHAKRKRKVSLQREAKHSLAPRDFQQTCSDAGRAIQADRPASAEASATACVGFRESIIIEGTRIVAPRSLVVS
jgi:hypothetical protein